MDQSKPPITATHAARILGRSVDYVRRHDAELGAVRTAGGIRLFDEALVRAHAAKLAERTE
jgi:hypothetical protein